MPDPPGPGEARPWFLTDRLVRAESTVTLLPSLEGQFPTDREALVVGYGCNGAERGASEMSGRVVAFAGGATQNVPVQWLEEAPADPEGCGWLVGRIGPGLASGLWRFEPPTSVGERRPTTAVEFRVVGNRP